MKTALHVPRLRHRRHSHRRPAPAARFATATRTAATTIARPACAAGIAVGLRTNRSVRARRRAWVRRSCVRVARVRVSVCARVCVRPPSVFSFKKEEGEGMKRAEGNQGRPKAHTLSRPLSDIRGELADHTHGESGDIRHQFLSGGEKRLTRNDLCSCRMSVIFRAINYAPTISYLWARPPPGALTGEHAHTVMQRQ